MIKHEFKHQLRATTTCALRMRFQDQIGPEATEALLEVLSWTHQPETAAEMLLGCHTPLYMWPQKTFGDNEVRTNLGSSYAYGLAPEHHQVQYKYKRRDIRNYWCKTEEAAAKIVADRCTGSVEYRTRQSDEYPILATYENEPSIGTSTCSYEEWSLGKNVPLGAEENF